MNFYTTKSFRQSISNLIKKPKEGYSSVIKDICSALLSMPDNIIRDTNDRILQTVEFRLVKLRLPNSGQHLPKANGFRLIYIVSLVKDEVFLLHVYPKRGPQGTLDLQDNEYKRLVQDFANEYQECILHQVNIHDSLNEIE